MYSVNASCVPSSEKRNPPQPPPSKVPSTLSLFGSRGSMTWSVVRGHEEDLVRRVEAPADQHRAPRRVPRPQAVREELAVGADLLLHLQRDRRDAVEDESRGRDDDILPRLRRRDGCGARREEK